MINNILISLDEAKCGLYNVCKIKTCKYFSCLLTMFIYQKALSRVYMVISLISTPSPSLLSVFEGVYMVTSPLASLALPLYPYPLSVKEYIWSLAH